jgi:hypothetical protein
MPVIPATWEAEIRGSQFEGSPGKKEELERPYLWWHRSVLPATWKAQVNSHGPRPVQDPI